MRQEAGQGMNFLEAIFSFVFGDGNPNESFEDRRWRLVSTSFLIFVKGSFFLIKATVLFPVSWQLAVHHCHSKSGPVHHGEQLTSLILASAGLSAC